MMIIDTHTHLDGDEFADDLPAVVSRAKAAGVGKVFLPAIDLPSTRRILRLCDDYAGFAYPMVGLHPEEVRGDYREALAEMRTLLTDRHIAIGEVGLDFYWSREYEREQLEAFEEQVRWSVESRLPLMIHCRKGQNEMVRLLRGYERELPGGVFHCFTGNAHEAEELLRFDRFVLGVGGVLTFKKSNLPDVLPSAVPLNRIVLETDAPYMAPVPQRGQRNESSFLVHVIKKLAEVYGVTEEEVASVTTATAERIFTKAAQPIAS